MEKTSKIYVAGHRGLVGSALLRVLNQKGYSNILTRSHKKLDLTRQQETEDFLRAEQPEYVFVVAARVGGIAANIAAPAEFILQNLQIACNVISAAYTNQVKKLLFLGSSCIYPKKAPQPTPEEALLTSPLEKTNEAYSLAKIAGLKMCQYYREQYGADFLSAMPCNLYGIQDNFSGEASHVLPALLKKFHEAKIKGKAEVTVWGSGKPLREFLYADDLAEACIFLMNQDLKEGLLNVGSGEELTIADLAERIKEVTGFQGKIVYDTTRPDGTYRKIIKSDKIRKLGWKPKVDISEGLQKTYEWYVQELEK